MIRAELQLDLALEQAQVLVEPPSALAALRMIHHSHPYLINGKYG